MSTYGRNVERLAACGLIMETPLPDELQRVVDELTDEELTLLEDIKDRLEKAGGRPERGFTTYVWY